MWPGLPGSARVSTATFGHMTSTAVLAQADSVANWLSVAGQWASALATVFVAFKVDQWQRRRDTEERRDRETAQARLVTITVDYSSYGSNAMSVAINNHSEQQVRWPEIESISNARPRVRWGPQVYLVDEVDGEEYVLRPDEVLLPHTSTRVPYQHVDDADRPINRVDAFLEDTIKRDVRVDDVTITFDMSGAQWRRTGNRDPIRVAQHAPTQRERLHPLRAQVGPFVADWVSRIRRRVLRR